MATKKSVDYKALGDLFSTLTVKETGKLVKAVTAYFREENHEYFLNPQLEPVFILLVSIIQGCD